MDLRKRITAFIVVLSIFSLQVTPILATSDQSDLLVLKARDISVKAKDGDVKGTAEECTVIENPVQGVKSFLNEETEIFVELDNQNTDTIFSNEDSMYVQNGLKINVKEVQTSDAIVVTEGIDIHSKQFSSSDFTILYCENGDIELNVTDMVFNGLIYAPNGTVSINAKNVDITGAIIADTIDINAKVFNIAADAYSNDMHQYLDNFRNDGYIKLAAYFRENEFYVDFKSNIDVKNATVYGRFEDADTFVEIGQIEGTSGSVGTVEYQDKMDVIVIGTDAFGEQAESNIVSFGRGAEGEVWYTDFDTDEDGIDDGIEIFYTKTNPKLEDSDGDGFSDKMESFYLYTDPNVYTEDSDFDNDGLSNAEEIASGTLVYLEDTDFDGKKDGEDTEPLKRNGSAKNLSNTIEVGKFDKVVSGFDENGNLVQSVYDFINERTKIEVQKNVVFTYYYNYDGNISSKVGKVDGDYRVNTYTYDGDKVAFLSNNNYHYGFQYNDNCNIIEITLNDELLIAYDYLDDGSVVTTYGDGYVKSEIKSENQITASDNEGILYTVSGEENAERYEFADSGFVLKYTYDEEGDLTGIESGFDFAVQYEELEGSDKRTVYRIDEKTYTQENIYTETEEGSMSTTNLISGDMISVYQNGENQMIQEHILDGVGYKTVYTYDEQGDLKEIVYPDGNTVAYDYNETGSLCATYENGVLTHEYSYDSINRLIGEVDYKEQVKKTYEYDIYDNILQIQTYNFEDTLIAEDTYSYNTEYGDQLATYNSIGITYDASGNPLTYLNGETFKWKGDKLSEANINGKNIQFYYDREGMPVSKVVNGKEIQYLMEGNDFIGEKSEGKTKVYMYDSSCSVVGFIYEGVPYYYVKNASNDVVGIVNQNYEMLCQYQYDTWGNIISITGNREIAKENPFRYRGYYYDEDLQMYNLKTRFYDSQTGRFISMDDKEAALYEQENLNLYAYCNNNPVDYYDPLGRARKYIYILSLEEFSAESHNVEEDLNTYFDFFTNSGVFISDNLAVDAGEGNPAESYRDVWNQLPSMDVVVINTHGKPTTIIGDTSLTETDVRGLAYKSVKVLILLGCNNGHWDKRNENIAYAFATRITGCVVASDGTVRVYPSYNNVMTNIAYFESINSSSFKRYCSNPNRDNYGWLIYKEDGTAGVLCYQVGLKTITMVSVLDNLISRGFCRFK